MSFTPWVQKGILAFRRIKPLQLNCNEYNKDSMLCSVIHPIDIAALFQCMFSFAESYHH